MATSQKISALNEASSPKIEDVLPIVSDGETKKVTLDVIIQQASITTSSYVNSLLLNYASKSYVNTTVNAISSTAKSYTDTLVGGIASDINNNYARISYVAANYLPNTELQNIIAAASAATILYSDVTYIPYSEQQNTITTASAAAAEYADLLFSGSTTLGYVKVEDLPSVVAAASSLAVNYTDSGFVPLSSVFTITNTSSSLAVLYANATFVPLSGIASFANSLTGYSNSYADNNFVKLTSVNTIVNTASSLATLYSDAKFIPLTSLPTIYNTARTTAANDIFDIRTTVTTYSAAWLNPTREFEFVNIGGIDTSFSGVALYGSSKSASVWTIKKIEYNAMGGVTSVKKAVNAIWDNRATSVVYV